MPSGNNGIYFQMQAPSNSVPEISSAISVRAMKWHERVKSARLAKGWSIPDLAREMGYADNEAVVERLYKYDAGKVENPRGAMLAEIASALGMTEIELRAASQPESSVVRSPPPVEHPNNAIIGGTVGGFAKIPIRGQGMGGRDGALVFNGDQHLGDVLAPPVLANVSGAYAVYVVGDSMLDRMRPGEVVYVNPHQPVRKGDDCVVQVLMPDGERHGWVKRYISRDENWVKVEQLNPKKTLRFKASTVVSVHKIIMFGPA